MVSRKQISLGLYAKLEDAIAARNAGEEKYYRHLQKKVDAIKREGIRWLQLKLKNINHISKGW